MTASHEAVTGGVAQRLSVVSPIVEATPAQVKDSFHGLAFVKRPRVLAHPEPVPVSHMQTERPTMSDTSNPNVAEQTDKPTPNTETKSDPSCPECGAVLKSLPGLKWWCPTCPSVGPSDSASSGRVWPKVELMQAGEVD